MDRDALAARIDHTVLGPETTPGDVRTVLDEAREHGMNACVAPCYVPLAADYAPDVTLVAVVGFPHGQHAPDTKIEEATRAWQDGADELDVVVNVGRVHAGEADVVRSTLHDLAAAVPTPVKAIVETALLSDAEKRRVADCARDAGVDMLKTSTGFADGGATVTDVRLLAEYLPVKASGGVGDYEAAVAMLDAGAERIGASRGVDILDGAPGNDGGPP